MKFFILSALIASVISMSFGATLVEAKSKKGYFYKSASTGRFVTPSYSSSHKSTTYKSSFR